MKLNRLTQAIGLITTLGVITLSASSSAETGSAAAPPAHFAWNRDSVEMVVSYREIWSELAEQDPTPLNRIFGDGRVLVHYAIYANKAGDYELWLKPEELANGFEVGSIGVVVSEAENVRFQNGTRVADGGWLSVKTP